MSLATIIALDSDSMMLFACALLAASTLAFIFWIEPDPAERCGGRGERSARPALDRTRRPQT